MLLNARMLSLVPEPAGPTIAMSQLGVPEYWQHSGATGHGVRVGIIDSGIDDSHPLLAGAVVAGRSWAERYPDWRDQHGHGTAVAGIVRMIAPACELVAARVLNPLGEGRTDDTAEAVRWCVDQGCHIINISLGSTNYHAGLEAAIRWATEQEVLVVAAAGNAGPDADSVTYPAAYRDPVAVASVDEGQDWPSLWSSRGYDVDIAAPGGDVVAPFLNGRWSQWSGTSFAAPHISGCAVLLSEAWRTNNKQLPLESQLVPLLIRGARRPRNAPLLWDAALGFGILDLRRLMSRVVRIRLGDNHFSINGERHELDVPARIVDGRTLLPVRALSEALGAAVEWDGETETVTIDATIA